MSWARPSNNSINEPFKGKNETKLTFQCTIITRNLMSLTINASIKDKKIMCVKMWSWPNKKEETKYNSENPTKCMCFLSKCSWLSEYSTYNVMNIHSIRCNFDPRLKALALVVIVKKLKTETFKFSSKYP